jgi:hypothetical protein
MSGEVCGHEPKLRRKLVRVYDSMHERLEERCAPP